VSRVARSGRGRQPRPTVWSHRDSRPADHDRGDRRAGKTTLAAGLAEAIRTRGAHVKLLREPGGVEVAERIRTLVKDLAMMIGGRTEALLYAAARAQLDEELLLPTLERGTWVLLDRFVDSSLAYQGAGCSLGIELEQIAAINAFATGGLSPNRTLLLELDPRPRAGIAGTPGSRA